MKKFLSIPAAIAGLAILSACTGSNTASVINPDTGTPNTPAAPMEARVLDLSVGDTGFTPNILTLKQGENVVLRLKSAAGTHSFVSPDLDLNVTIDAEETKGFNIPTEKTGTFEFHSDVAGDADKGISGQIIIQ